MSEKIPFFRKIRVKAFILLFYDKIFLSSLFQLWRYFFNGIKIKLDIKAFWSNKYLNRKCQVDKIYLIILKTYPKNQPFLIRFVPFIIIIITYHHGPVVTSDIVDGNEDALAVLVLPGFIQITLESEIQFLLQGSFDFCDRQDKYNFDQTKWIDLIWSSCYLSLQHSRVFTID